MDSAYSPIEVKSRDRAYSLIEVKSLDEEKRVFRGWATTPDVDRVNDTINPLGAKFQNPVALLHQHNPYLPIGRVMLKKPTKAGIEFEAEIPVIQEPGPLKDRVDTAWGEIKAGLVWAVSIGFNPLKFVHNEYGGKDYQEIEIFELSTVSVPANARSLITSIGKALSADAITVLKQFDNGATAADAPVSQPVTEKPAASGKALPVVKLADPARVRAKPFVINRIII